MTASGRVAEAGSISVTLSSGMQRAVGSGQRESHLLLRAEDLRDMHHPVWGGHGWSVFLDHPEDIWRTIPYIEDNPIKIGLPKQVHPFVTRYDNWPLHEGHSMNSPYVKRLMAAGRYPRDRKC